MVIYDRKINFSLNLPIGRNFFPEGHSSSFEYFRATGNEFRHSSHVWNPIAPGHPADRRMQWPVPGRARPREAAGPEAQAKATSVGY